MKPIEDMTPETQSITVRDSDFPNGGISIRGSWPTSLILVSPTVIDADGTVHKPFAEIYWDDKSKQIDVRHSGDISDAAKLFFDELGERLWQLFKERL